MTDQELFLALGQIREDLVLEAERPQKIKSVGWKRTAAIAAALTLVVGGSLLALRLTGREIPIGDYVASQSRPDSGPAGTDDTVGIDGIGLDGNDYSSPDGPAQPVYSTGDVTIGETGDSSAFPQSKPCLVWLEPEEIFAEADAVLRGIVRNVQYYAVNVGGDDFYYYRFVVEITDCLRGDLAPGDIYNVLSHSGSTISGISDSLDVGSEAVFLARFADEQTGYLEYNDSRFCYADLAELYLTDGIRMLFVQGPEGILYDSNTYKVPTGGAAVTLDDVWAYCAEMAGPEPEGGFVPPEPNSTVPEA